MRSYRPTPLFIITIIALLITAAAAYLGLAIVGYVAARDQDITQRVTTDWRPDIRHCHHRDVDLWDCIRNPGDYKDRRQTLLAELRGETHVPKTD